MTTEEMKIARAMLVALKDACASLEVQASIYEHTAKVQNEKVNLDAAKELRRNCQTYNLSIAAAEAAGIKA